ncbi:MAG: hypothetical protein GXP31_02935 [Kiritimatiellaeota bacterium]|nr:hypothetical protein [Kiritimatiellota bacterium]
MRQQTRRLRCGIRLAVAGVSMLQAHNAAADVTARKERETIVIENARMRVEVVPAAGGRIRSWRLKPDGRELIALWKGRAEIGGALDDRAFFTAARYTAAVMHPGPKNALVRMEASHPSGLTVIKIFALDAGSPVLAVRHEFRNGTQASRRLFVRNFLLPGAHPQTDAHLYWVNGKNERRGTRATAAPDAHGYYLPDSDAWAALWHRETGDGVAVLAPGVAKFYFWRGSREFPTFEWLYPDVPPGRVLRTEVRFVTVDGQAEKPPDWRALAARYGRGLRKPVLSPLSGWVDEVTRFGITEEERARGFWLSIGVGDRKRRLPQTVPVDLPLDDSRWIGITVNVLADQRGPLRLTLPQQNIAAFLEVPGEDRIELLPVPAGPLTWQAGERRTVWLRVSSHGNKPGTVALPLGLGIGKSACEVRIRLKVWKVRIPQDAPRPFHVRGYCGGFPVWTGGYEVTDKGLKQLEAILAVFAEMGGDVLDWNGVWARFCGHVRIAGTNDMLAETAKTHPERIRLDALPRLDFSYYDPWFDIAKRYGVTRVEAYMADPRSPQWTWRLFDATVGRDRVKPDTPEARRVIAWFYREMKRCFEERGFQGFFCKISDEISPEIIPTYIATARTVRGSGWRPFTTITGMIARTARHIRAMNPYCDQWQLSWGLKDDFLALTHRKYVLSEQTHPLPPDWRPYTNGGARNTWGLRVLGPDGAVKISPDQVENFELLEDGVPLRKKGGSPWGNTDRGAVITGGRLHAWLYLSPTAGAPDEHRYDLRVSIRREAPDGKPLVRVDPTDEIWCYGGSSRPYRTAYSRTWCYPLMTLYHGFAGYGQWAFYHWNRTERIVWIDPASRVTVSPAWCGYRDGWRDALLFDRVRRRRGNEVFAALLGDSDAARLRIGFRQREVYTYRTVLNAADVLARNAARADALALLAE